jgi:L-amino acid N-acyltransferase YncA
MSHRTSTEDAARLTERATLRDGDHMLIRPLRQQDRPGVVALFACLSPKSRAQRFHSESLQITQADIDMATAGHVLVATQQSRIVALASFHPQRDPALAETAIVVADAKQRRGIGTALFQRVMRDARSAGIRRLQAEVLSSNYGMRELLRKLSVPLTYAYARGQMTIDIDLVTGQHELPANDGKSAA